MVYLVWARVHVLLIDTEKWNLMHTLKNMYNCCELDLFAVLFVCTTYFWAFITWIVALGYAVTSIVNSYTIARMTLKLEATAVGRCILCCIRNCCKMHKIFQNSMKTAHVSMRFICDLPLIVAGVVIASFAADLSLPPSEYFLFKLFNSISFCDSGTFDGSPDAFLLLEAVGAEIFLSKDKTALV